jgi:hypothetical protein
MKTKRVVAMFTVACDDDGHWTKSDIALGIECAHSDWTNATVWDSLEDFIADHNDGYTKEAT